MARLTCFLDVVDDEGHGRATVDDGEVSADALAGHPRLWPGSDGSGLETVAAPGYSLIGCWAGAWNSEVRRFESFKTHAIVL